MYAHCRPARRRATARRPYTSLATGSAVLVPVAPGAAWPGTGTGQRGAEHPVRLGLQLVGEPGQPEPQELRDRIPEEQHPAHDGYGDADHAHGLGVVLIQGAAGVVRPEEGDHRDGDPYDHPGHAQLQQLGVLAHCGILEPHLGDVRLELLDPVVALDHGPTCLCAGARRRSTESFCTHAAAQVGGFQLGFQLFGPADLADPTLHHDGSQIGHAEDGLGELLHHQDRDALVGDPDDRLVQLLDDQRGQAHGQLVEQEQGGPGRDGPGDRQHLLLAARQGPRRLVAPVLESREAVEGPVLDLPQLHSRGRWPSRGFPARSDWGRSLGPRESCTCPGGPGRRGGRR